MNSNLENKIHAILDHLSKDNVPLSKVVLHKFFYYLHTCGVNIGLTFEPWKYGPYSFDLAHSLEELSFWDAVAPSGNNFTITQNADKNSLSEHEAEHIRKAIRSFKLLSKEDYSFGNMELLGTILYCKTSLLANGISPTEDNIIEEFLSWKGDRYSEENIRKSLPRYKDILTQQ